MKRASYRVEGSVAVITLDNPPVNGLGHDVRSSIVKGLQQAQADEAVRAIVITGANQVFTGGADIREFNTPKAREAPTLLDVIAAAESSAKPVVAAINGVCMGGGLELSLGCHYRVAAPAAKLALPEVKLGLIPGAGGTQRLPRAVGVERALDMIVSGNPATASQLAGTALLDEVIEGDFAAGALEFARRVGEESRRPRLLRDVGIEFPQGRAFFDAARAKAAAASPHLPAPVKCVEAVQAAVELPFEEGIKRERAIFLELIDSPESRAMRHAFFGERAAAKIPDIPSDAPVRKVERVAIVGAGTMGGGIAMAFLNAGMPVTILESRREALDKGVATIRRNYESAVKRGKLAAAELDARMARLAPTLSYGDIGQADLVSAKIYEAVTTDASDLFGGPPSAGTFDPIDRSPPVLSFIASAPAFTNQQTLILALAATDATGVVRIAIVTAAAPAEPGFPTNRSVKAHLDGSVRGRLNSAYRVLIKPHVEPPTKGRRHASPHLPHYPSRPRFQRWHRGRADRESCSR